MIEIPARLHVTLRNLLHQYPSQQWIPAAQHLSERYRSARDGSALVQSALDALAYSAMLLPATYAQISGALQMIPPALTSTWQSALDIGSGPGTALWALAQHLPQVTQFTAIERDAHFVALAQQLTHDLPGQVRFHTQDVTQAPGWEEHDVVIIAHVLNELTPLQRQHVIASAWQAARQMLIIIEPGSPTFTSIISDARSQLIAAGGWVAAPCTHHHTCPSIATHPTEWCHFGQKVARPDFQRRARAAELGWEEAKFSMIAVSKTPITHSGARLMHDPIRHKGYIDLPICSGDGFTQPRILKRDTAAFRAVRHCRWGDWIELTPTDSSSSP